MRFTSLLCLLAFVFSSLSIAGSSVTFNEDWENGIDETIWKHFGYPTSILREGEGLFGSTGLDCNGDALYGSGVCLLTDYDLTALPWISLWCKCQATGEHNQFIWSHWSKYSSDEYGGVGGQPDKLCSVAVSPAYDTHNIAYREAYLQPNTSFEEEWSDELYNGIWMHYSMRINPWGTVSYFRRDTLRWESYDSIYPEEWTEQTFAIEGESVGDHQILDNFSLSFPSLHEDWENGLSTYSWESFGGTSPSVESGIGIFNSNGILCNDGGVVSCQAFNLNCMPGIHFNLRGQSTSSGSVAAGWSSGNAGAASHDLFAFIQVSPSTGEIVYSLDEEQYTEPWNALYYDNIWQNFTMRINPDSTVSFFRRDTLRWTSSCNLDIGIWPSQSASIQGSSDQGSPVVDELLVYPTYHSPAEYLQPLNAIFFLDSTYGWAVGDDGVILSTANGGAAWNDMVTGTALNLSDVDFVSSSEGWVSADSGKILVTVDGNEWITTETGYLNSLSAVDFANQLTGWTCGDSGLLLKTQNAGFNWTEQTHPLIGDITDVEVIDPTTVFASGNDGQIIRTLNGADWEAVSSGTSVDINSISFVSQQLGWATGDAGTILKTVNGGENWINQESTVLENLNSVSFYDASNGWIVGDAGVVLRTQNGGDSWVLQPGGRDPGKDVSSVSVSQLDVAWMVSTEEVFSMGGDVTGIHSPPCEATDLCLTPERNPVKSGEILCINVTLPVAAKALLKVFDLSGRVVQAVTSLEGISGTNTVNLFMRGSSGDPLAPGIYFIVCESSEQRASSSVIVLGN